MQIPENWQPPANCLNGRVILITGAANGIGAATAKACASHGATVILLDLNIRALEQVYDEIENAGHPQAAIYPLNLEGATEQDYQTLAETIEREFGRLDGLIHNAAMLGALIPVAHFKNELWHKIIQINLNAPFTLTHACLPLMMKTGSTSIVFSSDQCGRHGKAYWGAYGVSKAGLECLMQTLADELEANTQVRVNSIDTGPVKTNMRALAYPGEDPSHLMTPDEVSPHHLYLLCDDSDRHTGQQFSIQNADD